MAIGTTAAIIGASAIGAGATALGASKSADAAKSAARSSNNTQLQMFEQAREDSLPFMEGGKNALAALQFELGLGARPTFGAAERPDIQTVTTAPTLDFNNAQTMWINDQPVRVPTGQPTPGRTTFNVGDRRFNTMREAEAFAAQEAAKQPGMEYGGFTATPGYAFRVGEGTKAIERGAAARGGLNSGATMKALQSFGQNIAADEYGTYLNRLAAMSGFGQTSTGQINSLGANTATNIGNATMAAGAARGSAYQQMGQAGAGFAGNALAGLAYGGYLQPRQPAGFFPVTG